MKGRGRYMRFQRGEGLSTMMINPGIYTPFRRRRRRYRRQRGLGFGSFLKKVGKLGRTVVNNPLVRKFAKDVILPTALGAVKQQMKKRNISLPLPL